jgi:gas vesicle protein
VDNYKEEFQEMTAKINSDLKDKVDQFKKDTQSGQFKEAIRPWYNKIRKEIGDLKKYKG